jgi:hypothetical protein
MVQPRGAVIRWVAFGIGFAAPIGAQELASPARPPAIWYRASQQCPSDTEFLSNFSSNAVQPRLAEAGDHIDFLVTLVVSGKETVGRLERQTRAGTVAIRELRDPSCQRVAEGLALSLGLALEPGQSAPAAASPVPDAAPQNEAIAPEVVPSATFAAPSPVVPSGAAVQGLPAAATRRRVAIGAAGGALYGLSPSPLVRGQVFVDLDPIWPRWSSHFSARAGVVGAERSADTRIGAVRAFVLAGFVEGCPWRIGNRGLSLRPCLGVELGVSGVSHDGNSGLSDRTLWATPGVGLRASFALPHRFGVEASAGVQVPLLRSEVFAGASSLYRAENVLFQAALGFSFGLP